MIEDINGKVQTDVLYRQILCQENDLRNVLKLKGPFDNSVIEIRNSIRDQLERILFEDYDYAVSKDIEQTLWKTLFYRSIEEFRKRMKNIAAENILEFQKMNNQYQTFLSSTSRFYQSLIIKLQQRYNLVLDGSLDLSELISNERGDLQKSNNLHKRYLTCHRSFIFLGDLARYHRDIVGTDSQFNCTTSGCYYQKALYLFPDNGNPHNQLAVLATYEDDECNAVYRYFRCLASRFPFNTAKDNLLVLFEKNRLKLNVLSKKLDLFSPNRIVLEKNDNEMLRDLTSVFVRLHGILYTRSSLDTFNTLKAYVLQELELHLAKKPLPDNLLLRMLVVNIFSIHNVTWSSNPTNLTNSQEVPPQTSAEINQKKLLMKNATKLAIEFFGRVVAAYSHGSKISSADAKKSEPEQKKQLNRIDSNVLGAIGIFMEWLTDHPDMLIIFRQKEKKAWVNMWKAIASLLNQLMCSYDGVFSKSRGNLPALPEEQELRGFLPLKESLNKVSFSGTSSEEDLCSKIRIEKVLRFGHHATNVASSESLLSFSQDNKYSLRTSIAKRDTPFNKLSLDGSEKMKMNLQTKSTGETEIKSKILMRNSDTLITYRSGWSSARDQDRESLTKSSQLSSRSIDKDDVIFKPGRRIEPNLRHSESDISRFRQAAIGSGRRDPRSNAIASLFSPHFDISSSFLTSLNHPKIEASPSPETVSPPFFGISYVSTSGEDLLTDDNNSSFFTNTPPSSPETKWLCLSPRHEFDYSPSSGATARRSLYSEFTATENVQNGEGVQDVPLSPFPGQQRLRPLNGFIV
eukprot:TRINITY_DN6415_c0_g1_i1.p1 TRINITY_DN6415_c0_g1~~TRINITY_DN6415_c0_g1_i1.p1  ORF type:complete len:800 (+),score=151.54 TRINITY_DN6415_c0_g1_i1:67-2466(+)